MNNHVQRLMRNLYNYRDKGFTIVELGAIAFLIIVISALGLDIGILIFASDSCDKACKDCARAAGTAGRTPGQAEDAMNAALATHITSLNPLIMSNLTAQLMVYEDYSAGTPNSTSGGTTGPWVTTTGSALPGNSTSSGSAGVPSPYTPQQVYFTNSYQRTANPPGPYVAVRTTMIANVPAPLFYFGTSPWPIANPDI